MRTRIYWAAVDPYFPLAHGQCCGWEHRLAGKLTKRIISSTYFLFRSCSECWRLFHGKTCYTQHYCFLIINLSINPELAIYWCVCTLLPSSSFKLIIRNMFTSWPYLSQSPCLLSCGILLLQSFSAPVYQKSTSCKFFVYLFFAAQASRLMKLCTGLIPTVNEVSCVRLIQKRSWWVLLLHVEERCCTEALTVFEQERPVSVLRLLRVWLTWFRVNTKKQETDPLRWKY